MWKKNLFLALSVLAAALVGCGDDENGNGTDPDNGTDPVLTVDVGLEKDEASLITAGDMDVCQLQDRYSSAGTITLTNDNVYILSDGFPGTLVGNGDNDNSADDVAVNLQIEPGTLIVGSAEEALIITRGATIQANGTAADPIVMTSSDQIEGRFDGDTATEVSTGRGEWAGLALMGKAPSNECTAPCNNSAEGNIGLYGGDVATDSSGSLQYVVVRHAGNDIDGQGNELNGISYFGTGSGTSTDYIQVHLNLDDGIEHFGSNDFVSHAVLTGNGDDSVDWGQGWTGGVQHVVVVHAEDSADRGIEADNDGTNPEVTPISKVLVANATFVAGANSGDGITLRRGTMAKLANIIVSGFGDCIDIDEDATFNRIAGYDTISDDLNLVNSLFDCGAGAEAFDMEPDEGNTADPWSIEQWFNVEARNNRQAVANLEAASGKPTASSPELKSGTTYGFTKPATWAGNNVPSSWTDTDYVGAYDPDATSQWTDDWTIGVNGNDAVWTPASSGTLNGATPTADGTCPAGTTDVGDFSTYWDE
jgi:hypothetical protein